MLTQFARLCLPPPLPGLPELSIAVEEGKNLTADEEAYALNSCRVMIGEADGEVRQPWTLKKTPRPTFSAPTLRHPHFTPCACGSHPPLTPRDGWCACDFVPFAAGWNLPLHGVAPGHVVRGGIERPCTKERNRTAGYKGKEARVWKRV